MAMIFEVRVGLRDSDAGQADITRCVLVNAGVADSRIIEQYRADRCTLSWYERSRAQADMHARRIRSLKLKGAVVSVAGIKDADWTTRWKKYFKPFNITPDIRVVPLWTKHARIPAGSIPVYLDTTFAFGSGLHATTRMMAGFLRRCRGRRGRFLDIGTGSGLLALIARAYGAQNVYAIDIDPVAVKTAFSNCKANCCAFEYLKSVSFEDFRIKGQFDFVAANLLTQDLIRLQKKLVGAVAPGGYLAVSGIFHDNYPLFSRRFSSRALVRVAVAHEKKWYAVLFRKRAPAVSPLSRQGQVSVE